MASASRSDSKTRLGDVAEVLAVGLQRQRHGRSARVNASRSWPESTLGSLPTRPRNIRSARPGAAERDDLARSDEVEAGGEVGGARDRERHRARVGVGPAVGDEHERRAPVALDLELRRHPEPLLDQDPDHRREEGDVARAPAVPVAAAAVDAPHRLGVEPDPGGEAEAAAVHAPEADRGASGRRRAPRRRGRRRQPDRAAGRARAGRHSRPPPGRKPNGSCPAAPLIASL